MTTKFNVTCSDARVISATKYSDIESPSNSLIIINSALGVKQSFYQALAQFLSDRGYTVITWDPRGIGESKKMKAKIDPAKLRDWGAIDLEAMLNHVVDNNWASWQNITLLGHSAGGHLVGLCRSLNKIKRIILISAGTCGWYLYPMKHWPRMWFAWYLLFPILIKAFGYIPAKAGVGHDLPKGVALDWRNWSTNKEYLFSDRTISETYYFQFEGSIQAIGFSDDTKFSPPSTIDDLMKRFPRATIKTKIYQPKELDLSKIGHFGFFRKDKKRVWEKVLLTSLNNTNLVK